MKQSTPILTLTLAAVAAAAFSSTTSEAFCIGSSSTRTTTTQQRIASTALNLLPEQGKQLEAAMNAAYSQTSDLVEEEEKVAASTTATVVSQKHRKVAARAFVSRVFSLPSSMIRRHPHPTLEGLPSFAQDSEEKRDVVLFPLVGFRFVQDEPNHYRVLPTQSNPSCRLRNTGKGEPEALFGWFSEACPLNLYSENYVTAPSGMKAEFH